MHALVSGKARMAARTMVARAGGVFMWPGIALTERRGAACVPVAADVARFWISRLHGPAANDWAVLRGLAIAAQKLSEGDEAGAQRALDASGLTRLSSDGVALMRAVAGSLGIGPLDLPWAEGPRLWRDRLDKLCDRSPWQPPYLQGIDPMEKPKGPKVLDAIADVVLAYRPKPKTRPARERQQRRRRLEKAGHR